MTASLPNAALLQRTRAAVLRLMPDLEALYAFGSVARGDSNAQSDLDVAVLGNGPIDPTRRFTVQRELAAELDRDVDLVDLQSASSVLRIEATTGGIRLYARDDDRALDFEARVLGEYADLLDATRDLRLDIRERGWVHGR